MADNYLERQMEQYRSGKTVIRHLNPSLDILLHKLAEQDAVAPTEITAETDPSRIVRKAQLEAALRSARIVFGDTFRAEISEAGQYISIDEEGLSGKTSGITLAIRLKAAELGLAAAVKDMNGRTVIQLYRKSV